MTHSWRLNERHYGALQGLNKAETAANCGDEQNAGVAPFVRHASAGARDGDERIADQDPRYAMRAAGGGFPRTGASGYRCARGAHWETMIVPQLLSGKRLLVAAHGNSLRALISISTRLRPGDRWPEHSDGAALV